MCGIVGLISKSGSFSYYADDLFTNLLRMDSIRGEDSTGVFGVTREGHIDIVKGDADGYLFTRTQDYQDFVSRMDRQYRIVIGHNRAATKGAVTAENAHPFREKNIVLVHNGTIHNKDELKKEIEVDSHAICHALSEHNAVEALGKIDGAYALVWFDKSDGTLNLARNNQRPLFIVEYESMYCIVSEPGLPLWLNSRENRKHVKVDLVPEEKILVIKLDQLGKGFFEVPYEEYSRWSAPVTPTLPYTAPTHTVRRASEYPPSRGSSNVVDLTANPRKPTNNTLIKAGEIINFVIKDSKLEEGSEVILGHPVFDDEVDENVVIRAVMPRNTTIEDVMKMMDVKKWSATVQAYRILTGIPVAFVRDLKPIQEVKDGSKNVSVLSELEHACSTQGCGKCKRAVTAADFKDKGIARKKADGTWRFVCPECLDATIKEVKASKPSLKVGVN